MPYKFPAFRNLSARRWWILPVSLLSLLLLGAGDGTVLSLSASGGGNFNENISISVTVRADAKVQNSNFYFEVRAPDGLVVDTHSVDTPSFEEGDTYSYSWNSNNSGYPETGNYTVYFCWSTGNARNCNVAQVSTGFYSVPTFGTVLTVVALILLGVWLWWMRHRLFRRETAA